MLDVACERGVGNVSVAHVVERSGVSRRTFYEMFADCEECFLAALDQALSYTYERVLPAYEPVRSWSGRIRAGLIALLCLFEEEPRIARMLIVESVSGGPRALARRGEVIAKLTHIVEEGVAESKRSVAPPPLTGEGVVGGVLLVIQTRLIERSDLRLAELVNPLMSMIVLPYLGAAAARGELECAIPERAPHESERRPFGDPFKAAGIRLTYRTVRVLMAIAEHPGASNRLIGETAEVRDQGQISKLLARLLRAGMVSNSGLGPGTGAPNEWRLTQSGRQVTDSIRAHSEDFSEKRGSRHGFRTSNQ